MQFFIMNIGNRIKNALKIRNMTQTQLAETTGYTEVYISNILRGVRGKNMNVETLANFAKALNVSMAYLLEESDLINNEERATINIGTEKTFPQLLKEILKSKQMTYKELSELNIGTGDKSIGHYATGKRTPSLDVVQNMARALKIPVGYFFNEISLEQALNSKEPNENDQEISKLLEILRDLDKDSIGDLLKQAEKEKSLQDYIRNNSSKKSS